MRSKWSSKHETSSQRMSLHTCFVRLIEDLFWHIIEFWTFSNDRQYRICIWRFMSIKFEIDSSFQFKWMCFFFSVRKISFELQLEIFEKIDVWVFVFNIIISSTNRFYTTSKFSTFSDSNVLTRSQMLHKMNLIRKRWLMQLHMHFFEI